MAKGTLGFFDVEERLAELSAKGDDLERVKALVDFELFRAALETAVPRAERSKGGRPPFDHVLMFKILILHAMHLSDERCEYLDQRSTVVPALSGTGSFRRGSRRQYDLDVSRGAEESECGRRLVSTI